MEIIKFVDIKKLNVKNEAKRVEPLQLQRERERERESVCVCGN